MATKNDISNFPKIPNVAIGTEDPQHGKYNAIQLTLNMSRENGQLHCMLLALHAAYCT